jgi:hypothetical protein
MTRTTTAPAWRRPMPPARYAPAAGTAMATCAATVRLGLDGPRRPDRHSPITGRALPRAVWWIIETKE